MKPELQSVKALSADENSTTVEIIYKTAAEMNGIELHGVDAGLSWLKGESKPLEKINYTIYIANYGGTIALTSECEFRGRAFDDNEDYWEDTTHKLKRNSDGSISLIASEEFLGKIKYSPKPPREYTPELYKIKLVEVKNNSSLVEICYRTSDKIEGLALHGVDAGLSWLKGESVLALLDHEDDIDVLKLQLEVESTVEFKARGFREDKDFWEEGGNHRIERLSDGTINFIQNPDDTNLVNLVNRLPVIYDLSLEEALPLIRNENEIPVQFLQYLVAVKFWFDQYIKDPFNQDLFDLVSGMTRSIREQSRKQKSQKIDDLVLPITKSLYQIYTEAISFLDEDVNTLVSNWKETGVIEIFEHLIEDIKKLELEGFGNEEDRRKRERTLAVYN